MRECCESQTAESSVIQPGTRKIQGGLAGSLP
jgi:hypothetical protein